jgi:Cu+-exporting ATPase
MSKKTRIFSLLVAVSFVFVLAGLAAQQATTQKKTTENTQEVVVCQVCGMKVDKAQNPITWDYKGKTYYFCSQGCKDAFMKDPESFLKEKPAEQGKAGGGMMSHGQMMDKKMMKGEKGMCCGMKMGKMKGCPMMMKDVEIKVENTKDGVQVILTSKNPETVKMIQDHMAKMKAMCMGKEGCPGAKKDETKKEPVKK